MGLASTRYFLPVTRALIQTEGVEAPLELFERLEVPKSPGYRILRFYEFHGAIMPRRAIKADARRILALQGGLRADRAVPDKHIPAGPPLDVAIDALHKQGLHVAVAMQTAANMIAYFEPSGAHSLYVQAPSKTSSTVIKALDALHTHPEASDSQPYEIHFDDLDRLDIRKQEGLPVTSVLQTLLDLALHGRSAAHKEFMFEQLKKQGMIHA